jgi:hypothetical protein
MKFLLHSQPFMLTLAVFFASVGSFVTLSLKDRKPRESLTPPLLPTIPLLLLSGGLAVGAFIVLMQGLKASL